MCNSFYISEVPLSLASVRSRVEAFLASNGLRPAPMDVYVTVTRTEDSSEILAGGGLDGNVIKCIAVSEEARSEGFTNKLVSYLMGLARERGHDSVKVFTKPENVKVFASLGFELLASAGKAVLMENGLASGLKAYRKYLSSLKKEGRNGAIVMNANPFTKGHRYLVEQAAAQVDHLYVIAVKEDRSRFPYVERLAMIKAGCEDMDNVTVCEGSDYAISAATFPTYFLKELSDASETHMALDIDLFAKAIAPALGVSIRFAGSEPSDAMTARYNALMSQMLPERGVEFIEIPRLVQHGSAVSASTLRNDLDGEHFYEAVNLAYPTTVPYLVAELAQRALQIELDTTPKPGLVDKNDSGAHSDMDYVTMQKSINALRPWFAELAVSAVPSIDATIVKDLGIKAEKAMLEATGGVNTHRGALFCIGLSIAVAANLLARDGRVEEAQFRELLTHTAEAIPSTKDTHGAAAVKKYRAKGALDNAREAYPELFREWVPYYRSLADEKYREHMTLLKIMTTLDDTNILHRCGQEGLDRTKADAASLLADFSIAGLASLNREYTKTRISPGGSADMLSLTIFITQILFN